MDVDQPDIDVGHDHADAEWLWRGALRTLEATALPWTLKAAIGPLSSKAGVSAATLRMVACSQNIPFMNQDIQIIAWAKSQIVIDRYGQNRTFIRERQNAVPVKQCQ